MYYFVMKSEEYGNEVVFEDLFIICCRHVTLLESTTTYNDCIIYVIFLFTLRHNVTCFLLGMIVIIEKCH